MALTMMPARTNHGCNHDAGKTRPRIYPSGDNFYWCGIQNISDFQVAIPCTTPSGIPSGTPSVSPGAAPSAIPYPSPIRPPLHLPCVISLP